MEVSIKWNVCRICLTEDNFKSKPKMKYIFGDEKLTQQIYNCCGVTMKPDDSMPDKICSKCLTLLKYAIHFATTCRKSDEYLQSVVQKTKSATSLVKLEQRREATLELMDNIFYYGDDPEPEAYAHKPEIIGDSITVEKMKITKIETFKASKLDTGVKRLQENEVRKLGKPWGTTETKSKLMITTSEPSLNSRDKLKDDESDITELLLAAQKQVAHDIQCRDIKDTASSPGSPREGEDEDDSFGIDTNDMDDEHMDNLAYDERDRVHDDDVSGEIESLAEIPKEANTRMDNDEKSYFYVVDSEMKTIMHSDGSRDDDGEVDGDDDMLETTTAIDLVQSDEGNEEEEDGDIETDDGKTGDESDMTLVGPLIFELTDVDENPQTFTLKKSKCGIEEVANTEGRLESVNATEIDGREWPKHSLKKINNSLFYVCGACGNQFTNRSLMNHHMRLHRNEKKFECELCFKRFNAACNLTAHMRIHTGEKPFECQYCKRRFNDRSTQIKHERIHTNEKPFQCRICDKSFSLSSTLRAHEKVHTGEKPYRCETCNKCFKLPHQLKAHLKSQLHKLFAMEQSCEI